MKTIAACLAVGSLLAFWRVHAVSKRELETLGIPLNAITAEWEAKNVPRGRRVVTFLISDASSGRDPLVYDPPAAGVFEDAQGWVGRNLIGGDPALKDPTLFAKKVADSTTLVWSHEGFSVASEEAMTREIERAVIKANAAGAELNIVAQGAAVGPVMTALKRVEGKERAGVKVNANKVVLVGADWPRLKRVSGFSSYSFKQPGNVRELASMWVPRDEFGRKARMRLNVRGSELEEVTLGELWPNLAGEGEELGNVLAFLRDVVHRVESIERQINIRKEALREAAAMRAAAILKEAQTKEDAAAAAAEADRREADARRAANEAAAKQVEAEVARKAAMDKSIAHETAVAEAAKAATAAPPIKAAPEATGTCVESAADLVAGRNKCGGGGAKLRLR